MDIYPDIALSVQCPTCGEISTFLSSALLDQDRSLRWACGHTHSNNTDIFMLAKFYHEQLIESTKKLHDNKEAVEKYFNIAFPSQIIMGEVDGQD